MSTKLNATLINELGKFIKKDFFMYFRLLKGGIILL